MKRGILGSCPVLQIRSSHLADEQNIAGKQRSVDEQADGISSMSGRVNDPDFQIAERECRSVGDCPACLRIEIAELQGPDARGRFEGLVAVGVVMMIVRVERVDDFVAVVGCELCDGSRVVRRIDHGGHSRGLVSDEIAKIPISAGLECLDQRRLLSSSSAVILNGN